MYLEFVKLFSSEVNNMMAYYDQYGWDLTVNAISDSLETAFASYTFSSSLFWSQWATTTAGMPTLSAEGPAILMESSIQTAVNLYLWVIATLAAFPFISGCGHHFKLAGDSTMRVASMIPETFPVIEYIEDEKGGKLYVKTVSKSYELSDELIEEIIKGLQTLLKSYGSEFAIPKWAFDYIIKAITFYVADKIIAQTSTLVVTIPGTTECASKKSPWKYCYVGGFTAMIESVTGPLFIPKSFAITFNPLMALWEEKGIKELLKSAAMNLLSKFANYVARKLVIAATAARNLLSYGIAAVITCLSAFRFIIQGITITPVEKWD